MKVHHAIMIAAVLAGGAACSGSAYSTGPSGNPPPPNTVDALASLAFDPSTLTVATGTSVTFTFQGVGHNVTFTAAAGVPADVPTSSNTSVQRTFATAGTFSYHCTIHPQMTGTIVVQ